MTVKSICVFCGAKNGTDPLIKELATAVGNEIAKQGLTVVYGGADSGLMGALTTSALEQNGDVIGVYSDVLNHIESVHDGLKNVIMTHDISARKLKMIDLSDAFLVLPGGYGTLDEIFEVLVLKRINGNNKPVVLFNYNGFWDCMLKQIERTVKEGFVPENEHHPFIIVHSIEEFRQTLTKLKS
jgi:hypothetical protein